MMRCELDRGIPVSAGVYPPYESSAKMLIDIIEKIKKSDPDKQYFRNGIHVDVDTYFYGYFGNLEKESTVSGKVESPEPVAPELESLYKRAVRFFYREKETEESNRKSYIDSKSGGPHRRVELAVTSSGLENMHRKWKLG